MKKILLSLTMLAGFYNATGQLIEASDFTSYTNGNIGTLTNGSSAGQGGFFTLGGENSDYRILNGGVEHGRVFQITGSATSTVDRFMWKNGLAAAWASRDAGNDILEIEFDYFTGPVTTSQNSIRLNIYNADLSKLLAGYMIAQDTKMITGLAYYEDDPGNGTYQYSLGTTGTPDVILPADSWVRLGISFKKSDGKVIWKGPGFDAFTNGTTAGQNPDRIYFMATAIYADGAENTVASTARFDNYTVRATATDMLLNVNDSDNGMDSNIVVFPNPATDIINIASKTTFVEKIVIIDMNGRTVQERFFKGNTEIQMDLSELSKGIYMMNILSDRGSIVKKIVKK